MIMPLPLPQPASSPTPTTDELIRSAVDLARICLGMEVGFVTEIRDGVRIFRHVASAEGFSPIRAGQYDPLEQSYCQYIVSGAIPAKVQDSHQYPLLAALPVTRTLQIRAHLGVPIRFSDGTVFGTFCCYSRNPKVNLNACDVDAMSNFAYLIGQLMEAPVKREREHEARVARMIDVLKTGRFDMLYQPVVDIERRQIIGYEALARFDAEPERSPDQWFDEAHAVKLGHRLEVLAIGKAIKRLARIPDHAYLALNVSPQTILSGALDEVLRDAPLDRLLLEVTEHSQIPDYGEISAALFALRARGLRIAVDDAGSGYASFRHILKLKPEVIKLDQSIIRHIDDDPGARALAAAIVTFARETGSIVVGEGVETDDELETLAVLGVHTVQGYLLGRPAPLPPR